SWVHHNQADSTFAAPEDIPGLDKGFSEDNLRLADMNGDGLLDVVQAFEGIVACHLSLGRGRFGAIRELPGLPEGLPPQSWEFTDINGDGLADAVNVVDSEVRYALNRSGVTLSAQQVLTSGDVEGDIPFREA